MVCDTFGKNRETKSIDDNMVIKYHPKNSYGNNLWVDTFCHPRKY